MAGSGGLSLTERGAMTAVIWLEFSFWAAMVAVAGHRLSLNGDVIAEKTGLSGNWIGLALLATVTSLPELVTGVGSITAAGAPDMAVGDALGSCVFNLMILLVADLVHRPAPSFGCASQGHILASGFGILALGLVASALVPPALLASLRLGWVGLVSPALILVYAVSLRAVFVHERRAVQTGVERSVRRHDGITLRAAVIRYAIAATVVIVAGLRLPVVAERLAQAHGLSDGFVGTTLVAATTSMPEFMVTLAAVRIGALDMAFANLLGSNLFNMVVLAVDDLVFTPGPLLAVAAPTHAMTALSAMMMNGVVIVALLYRPQRRLFGTFGWTSLALLGLYLLNVWALVATER